MSTSTNIKPITIPVETSAGKVYKSEVRRIVNATRAEWVTFVEDFIVHTIKHIEYGINNGLPANEKEKLAILKKKIIKYQFDTKQSRRIDFEVAEAMIRYNWEHCLGCSVTIKVTEPSNS